MREFLVDGIRGYIESQGVPFPSLWGGKVKMFLQCWTIGVILLYVSHLAPLTKVDPYAKPIVYFHIWGTIAFTVHSAYDYIKKGIVICSDLENSSDE